MGADQRHAALWRLVASQVALIGFLGLCVAIRPGVVLDAGEPGVSNYGVRVATVVPYTIAFAGCAALLWLAGRALPVSARARRGVKLGFDTTAALLAAVLVSTYPYKVDRPLDLVHVAIAGLLFVDQLILMTWMALVAPRRGRHLVVWLVWVVGFTIGAATLAGRFHLLLTAQVVMMAGFATLTIDVTRDLIGRAPTIDVTPC